MSENPTAESVAVRMYRGILGDCFLLTHRRGNDAFHALIDCGALQCIGDRPKTKAALGKLPDVVADLRTATGGRINLVVVTHEHYDHVSGFMLEHEAFETFDIDSVWVAWTESQTDSLANDIRDRGRRAISVLKAVVEGEKGKAALDKEGEARRQTIEGLLQFYDDDVEAWSPPDAFGAAKKPARPYDPATDKPRSCANAITWLRFKSGEKNVKYLEPGQVLTFGLENRLKASVLGPPRGDRLLQMDPSKGAQREVYLAKRDDIATLETILRTRRLGVAGWTAPAAANGAAANPFSARFNRSADDHRDCRVVAAYFDKEAEGRRIDGEWLGSAETLALKIDGDVNNTSLALAIELPGAARHVLLFPADAQVGNWLSWHDQSYPLTAPEDGMPVIAKKGEPSQSAQDLLSRVILYKVGHHGSHNATAREKGLEMMTSPHLAAMIPVVGEVAREQTTVNNKTGWEMPYKDLNTRLLEKTQARVLQGDGDPTEEAKSFAGSIFELAYEKPGDAASRWVELSLPLGAP